MKDIFRENFDRDKNLRYGYRCETVSGNSIVVTSNSISLYVSLENFWGVSRKIKFKNDDEYNTFMNSFIKVLELIYYKYPVSFDFDNYDDRNDFSIIYKFNDEVVDFKFLEQLYDKHDKLRKTISYEDRGQVFYSGERKINAPNYNDVIKSNKMIYDDLIRQYEKLSEEEKDAILIYKTSLFECINLLSSVPNFRDMDSEQLFDQLMNNDRFSKTLSYFINSITYKNKIVIIHDNPDILEMFSTEEIDTINYKYKQFDFDLYKKLDKISLKNKKELIESLINVYDLLCSAASKIVLRDEVTLFRGVSLNVGDKINGMARGPLISTAMDFNTARMYLTGEKKDKHILRINASSGVHCIVSPYTVISIDKDYRTGRSVYKLIPEEEVDSLEVIIPQDEYNDFEFVSSEHFDTGKELDIIVDRCEIYPKKGKKNRLSI